MDLTNARARQKNIHKGEGTNGVDGLITIIDFAIYSWLEMKWKMWEGWATITE